MRPVCELWNEKLWTVGQENGPDLLLTKELSYGMEKMNAQQKKEDMESDGYENTDSLSPLGELNSSVVCLAA